MNSIRRLLTRRLVLMLAAQLGAGLLAIYITVWFVVVDAFDTALRSRALAVSALTEVEAGHVAFDFSPDFLQGYGATHARNYFELWDGDGTVLVRSPSLHDLNLARDGGASSERPEFHNTTLPNGRPGRTIAFFFEPTVNDSTPRPPSAARVQLTLAADRGELNETLGGLLAGVAGCGVLLAAAVALIVPRVLRRGLAPLNQLGEQTARIDAGSLGTRFQPAELPDELRPIAERLNDLLARLERSFERERRFSADLAHELRTPLAELRTLAECALKWPESRDPATDRETLAIAQQMETLVTHMLALARGEQGQLSVRSEPIALEKLVLEVWRTISSRAAQRKLDVRFTLKECPATADPALLRSILTNLCDNAVDYTPVGGSVEVTVGRHDGRAVVRLANTTDQLEAADVAKLFDRFWRKEAARTGGQHFGLGLSLARTLATAMGWKLSAALEADHRIAFTLQSG